MGLYYTIKRENVALSTTNDLLTIIGAATRSWRIKSIEIDGLGTASAANAVGIYRVGTAGVTPGGAITPTPNNPAASAAALTTSTTWGTQPVVGVEVRTLAVNSNGGINRWVAIPNVEEIEAPGGANAAASISIRSSVGTGNVNIQVTIEEF